MTVWSYLRALANRARFYGACVRESDIIDVGCLCLALATCILGSLGMAALATAYCQWMAGR